MIIRSLVLCAASVALVACEPMEATSTGAAATQSVEAASAGGTAMPKGLTGEQQGIWNTYTDAGKKYVGDCMATGKSFTACSAA